MMADTNVSVSKTVTLIIAVITNFLLASMVAIVAIALPAIGKEFAMEAALLGWVTNAINLATAAVLLPFGRLADIYGRKKIFLCGMVISAISSFLCATSSSAMLLILYRVFQGIGSGMAMGTVVAILTSVFPGEERGRALGISLAAVYIGISTGAFLGGVLTQYFGWRSIFFLGTFLYLVVVGLTLWRLRGEWAEARGEKFDIVGAAVFGVSIVVILYGFTVLSTILGFILVPLGVLGMLAFVRWEARVASPVINLGLFRKNTPFIFSTLSVLINDCATYASTFLMVLYLQYTKGLPPQMAGLVMIAQPVFVAIFAPISGRISDRVEPRLMAATGLAFNTVAFLLFIFLSEGTALGYIVAGLLISGFGVGLFSSPNTNAIMSSVEPRFFGVASGAQGTMRSCGMSLGMAFVMILFSIYIGKAQITPEHYPAFLKSLHVSYMICTAIAFGGIFLQLAGRKQKELRKAQ